MRKVLIALLVMSSGIVSAKTPAGKLLDRICKLQKVGIMIGHQDDPVYGAEWKWERGRSDVMETCGDYPAVMGFDLGAMELGSDKNLDGVPFERMREEIIAQHKRGGIVTLSWHPWNPVTGENAWDKTGNAVSSVLNGAQKSRFDGWLTILSWFIGSLKTECGEPVPVIFRPWHEMSGGWFWWGKDSCTPEEYKQLFIYTYKTLVEKGCDNIVWAYSPNLGVDDFMKYYPGDEYVDMLGIDVYDFGHNNKTYTDNLTRELDTLSKYGSEHKKPIALTETGSQQLQYDNWFTEVLYPIVSRYPLVYVLFWRNAHDNPKELYISYPKHPTAPDFKRFHDLKNTLFVKDISKIH